MPRESDPLLVFELSFDTNLDGSWSMLLAGNGLPVVADSDAGNNGGFMAAGGFAQSGPKDIPELGMLGLFGIGFLGLMVARRRAPPDLNPRLLMCRYIAAGLAGVERPRRFNDQDFAFSIRRTNKNSAGWNIQHRCRSNQPNILEVGCDHSVGM